jgi:hypothetical protein
MGRRYDDDDDDFASVRRRVRRRDESLQRLQAPAISMGVVAVFSLVVFLGCIPIDLALAFTLPPRPGEPADAEVMRSMGRASISVILIALHALIAAGAYFMYKGKLYPLALTGAIIASIPCCSPCYFLGMPFGIWALVVLFDAEVQRAFQ